MDWLETLILLIIVSNVVMAGINHNSHSFLGWLLVTMLFLLGILEDAIESIK